MCNHSKSIPIMHQTLAILILLLAISIDANYGQQINGVNYNNTNNNNNNNNSDSEEISAVIGDLLKRNERSIYLSLAGCALTMETNCFMGVAEDFVQTQKRELIVEFDREVAARSVGRADQPTSSQLIETIMRGFNELTEIIRENLYEWFKTNPDAKESQDIENNEANRNDTSLQKSRGREIEESRKKKKKKGKIHALIKAIIIGVLLFFKIKFLFKLAAIALQVKFFLVALGGLLLNAARLWIDLKKKKEPQKVIYYEHAQHQHHYEGDEDDWHVSEPEHEHGSYWGRAYETAQDLAYAKQKPDLVKKQTENNSWGLF